jgi:hypothetical protein
MWFPITFGVRKGGESLGEQFGFVLFSRKAAKTQKMASFGSPTGHRCVGFGWVCLVNKPGTAKIAKGILGSFGNYL